jgi:H+/Cl- antiporter ClcA
MLGAVREKVMKTTGWIRFLIAIGIIALMDSVAAMYILHLMPQPEWEAHQGTLKAALYMTYAAPFVAGFLMILMANRKAAKNARKGDTPPE